MTYLGSCRPRRKILQLAHLWHHREKAPSIDWQRVAGGLGTIARVVGDLQEIYARRLPVEDALLRIELLYKPYHRALQSLLHRTQRRFGLVLLVDCHSMPSAHSVRDEHPKADFVIGDRYGTSASGLFADTIDQALRSRGYGCHAIQIEINRGLYMDERRLEKSPGFAQIASDMMAITDLLAREATDFLSGGRLAAE